ncbi:MAG: Ferredoxin-NADP reductase [Frankiales bacterium]|nr:Ferredoxin-NADP reductase [Frankiales bacterium]
MTAPSETSATAFTVGEQPGSAAPATGLLNLIVRDYTVAADGVVSLLLASPDGSALPIWEPGAHIDVVMPEVTRQYSLCGDPERRDEYRLGILLEPASRGGSRYIHDTLRPGAAVSVSRPRNHFALVEGPAYLFIAGGIGITPLLPMIAQVESRARPWRLVYGGRTLTSMAFLGEISRYGDKVSVHPQDVSGLLDLPGLLDELEETLVYCCGPEPLLAAVEARCSDWPPGRLHVERFAARTDQPARINLPFEVECRRSGFCITIGADETMLEGLLAAGIDADSDCEEGICGTCEMTVLEGVPDHRDDCLSEEERSSGEIILPCVSRAVTRIVIDA